VTRRIARIIEGVEPVFEIDRVTVDNADEDLGDKGVIRVVEAQEPGTRIRISGRIVKGVVEGITGYRPNGSGSASEACACCSSGALRPGRAGKRTPGGTRRLVIEVGDERDVQRAPILDDVTGVIGGEVVPGAYEVERITLRTCRSAGASGASRSTCWRWNVLVLGAIALDRDELARTVGGIVYIEQTTEEANYANGSHLGSLRHGAALTHEGHALTTPGLLKESPN
jgi:hypothetical protein